MGSTSPALATTARAAARSISAEMHSGFATLRNDMSMDLLSRLPSPPISAALGADIERIATLWREARVRFGKSGPFLFGAFTNADAMYAPVATRFTTYDVKLDAQCAAYVARIMALPEMIEWIEAARNEAEEIDELDMEF